MKIRCATFNIRYDNPQDGPWAWPKRVPAIERYLNEANLDIVGFQEAMPHQRERLTKILGDDYCSYGLGRESDLTGEQCPIYWRKAEFEKVQEETYWLSSTPEQAGSRSWTGINDQRPGPPWLARLVTKVRLTHRTSQRVLDVLNTHYDYEVERARLNSSELIVQRQKPSKFPTIIMGDFNAECADSSIRLLEQHFHNLVASAPENLKTPTWHDFRGTDYKEGQHIDFFFTTADLRCADYQVICQPILSDHFPVEVTLDCG